VDVLTRWRYYGLKALRAIILIENLSSVYAAKRMEYIASAIMSNIFGTFEEDGCTNENNECTSIR
jgi:hypothetical protein